MKNQNNRFLLTKEGLDKLKKELDILIKIKRPQVVERMASAHITGDMIEESDYIQAKQELIFIDGRITELGEVISRVKLIDENHGKCQKIKLGCKITVADGNKENIFHLVGEWEADPSQAKISHQSLLGQSLLGKKINDKIEVQAPVGKIIYQIVKID